MSERLDLDAIEARAAAAISGPWTVGSPSHGRHAIVRPADGLPTIQDVWVCDADAERQGTMQFIAHARDDVPALIAEVRRLSQRPTFQDVVLALGYSYGMETPITSDRYAADAVLALFPKPEGGDAS